MSATTNANVQTSIPESWDRLTLRRMLRDTFWDKWMGGEGSGMPFIRKTQLQSGPGDLIHVQVTDALSGAGVSGDETTLEGNEENLTTSEIQMNTTLYRHAVLNHRRANKKSILDLQEEASMRLAEWGRAKMDSNRFSQLVSTSGAAVPDGVYTPNLYVAGGGATIDDVVAANSLSVAECRKIRYALDAQQAEPFIKDGMPWYFLITSPQAIYDLKQDVDYDSYVVNAASRGFDNPVFTGAVANIDGLIVLSHWSVPVATNANAAPVDVAKSIAFGKEAFIEVLDENATFRSDEFDYGNKLGTAFSFAHGTRRALERNSLQVYVSSADPLA